MTRRLQIVSLLLLTVSIYVVTAARPSLLDDADASHALAARAVLEDGHWAVLHINGVAWLEKPPLHYWLVAASYALLGETAFATRLPSALAVVALVLLVYSFGCRFFGERAGFYAGLVMSTSVGTFLFTRIMIPEAIYALEFTAIFYVFLRAWTGTLDARIAAWAIPALIGLAALTRAGIGPSFPVAIIGLFIAAVGGSRRLCSRGAWPFAIGALVLALISVPWHLVAGARTSAFYWFYFVNEQFRRGLGTRYPVDYTAVPLGIWWAAHLVWFFPWTVFLPYAVREIPDPRRWRDLDVPGQARLFLCMWAAVILLFFTLVSGSRLEYYAFGSWPAVALLIGLGVARAEERRDAWLSRLQMTLAAIGVLVAGTLGALVWESRNIPATGRDISDLLATHPTEFYRSAMANLFDLTPRAFAALRQPAITAALALSIGFTLAWRLRTHRRTWAANLAAACAMVGFFQSANAAYAAFEPRLSSRPVADELLKWLRPDDRLVIYGDFGAGSSFAFYTHRQVWIYNGRYNGLEFGSYLPDAPHIFLTDRDFPDVWNGPTRVFLLVPPEQRQHARLRLPHDRAYLVTEKGGKALFVNRPLDRDRLALETQSQIGVRWPSR